MAWHRAWGKGVMAVAVVMAATTIWAASNLKRAKPPHWTKSVSDAFFTDAREKLSGERPAAGGGGGGGAVAGAAAGGTDSDGGGASSGGVFTWSKLIGPEELE